MPLLLVMFGIHNHIFFPNIDAVNIPLNPVEKSKKLLPPTWNYSPFVRFSDDSTTLEIEFQKSCTFD
ncbi:hypothetical protein JTE90_008866 [Oedothorax gibbosus]|uniref:Uncharacterized protein n=1 Tax=Oedothorax gibbosus TaxID=931172 RepID=A0AAV6TSM1_9ARAC|nr:hypothetical protein JTE90_008866 [Oedothorax gibbosus]